jgi:glycosyltransferase involved in cell wall biosynthesis
MPQTRPGSPQTLGTILDWGEGRDVTETSRVFGGETPILPISVVIPVRNREHLIARAIESVMAQTLPVEEIIVVDDASTDRTVDAVEGFAKSLNNLTLISLTENVGAAKARNIGINIAKGDLIAFLDSDDVWYVDKLSKQVRKFQANKNVVAVFCGVVEVSYDGNYRQRNIPKMPDVSQADLYHSNMLVTMSGALILKKALLEIGGFDTSLPSCQDWDLFIRLSECGKLSVVQEELVEFWRHKGDRISRNKLSVLAGHETVFEKIYARISDPLLKRRVRASHELRMAEIFRSDFFEPFRAIRYSCRGLMLAPSWRNIRSVIKLLIKIAVFGLAPGIVEKWRGGRCHC